ncbi:MAG: bifunctional hydroxymethylpyrimidine kinase/phosphomethylpyrimidine kinase [Deltaproteobacteria bacterium]|nr:bifunctional hydroxymethylpyrimidine kinase/phosphomethylpyrimidine kinase [Deltaproteobacteria bacterium]
MKSDRIAARSATVRIPVAMTIAGSDPSGGAGLQADLKTFAAVKVYGLSVLTAVIAQNSVRMSRLQAVAPEMVAAQLEAVVAEGTPDALKIGALATGAIARVVAKSIDTLGLPAPVLDPVLVASSGRRLLQPAGESILRSQLIPRAAVVTPNIPEAETLSGIEINGMSAMRQAARVLYKLGPRCVLIKGGHWPLLVEAPRTAVRAIDLFFDGRRYIEFAAPRISGTGAHGTGCALSAAIAAWLARGADLETAIMHAKRFITRALNGRLLLGTGRCVLDHFAH